MFLSLILQEINMTVSNRHLKWILVAAVAVLLFTAAAHAVWNKAGRKVQEKLAVNGEYQAVFLANDQVYFGKLELDREWVILRDIYYLQEAKDLQSATASGTQGQPEAQVRLVKLGSEVHGPKDEMYIPKDKIMFWENLKSDSRVVQTIKGK
jgi:hypothetical protein